MSMEEHNFPHSREDEGGQPVQPVAASGDRETTDRPPLPPEVLELLGQMQALLTNSVTRELLRNDPTIGEQGLQNRWARVLSLQPGRGEDPVVCHLATQALDVIPSPESAYEAVSYTWGASQSLGRITCRRDAGAAGEPDEEGSSTTLEVTRNLLAVLRGLRFEDRPRRLWIDQICINQWDEDDKVRQIGIMAEIYSHASRVLIWLGDAGGVDDTVGDSIFAAMDLFALLYHQSPGQNEGFLQWLRGDELSDWGRCLEGLDYRSFSSSITGPADLERTIREMIPGAILTELESFRTRPLFFGAKHFMRFLAETRWFRRSWTFQETIMGHDTMVIFGKWTRNWDTLYDACRLFENHQGVPQSQCSSLEASALSIAAGVVVRGDFRREHARQAIVNRGASHPGYLKAMEEYRTRDHVADLKKFRLKQVLPALRCNEATEPKDKVLGVIGFAHDDGRRIELPNQRDQVPLLYLTVAKYWMTTAEDNIWIRTQGQMGGARKQLDYDEWPCPLLCRDPDLSLLSHVNEPEQKIPSWVPDWSCPLAVQPLIDEEGYRASASWVEPAIIDDSLGRWPRLEVQGIRLMNISMMNSHQAVVDAWDMWHATGFKEDTLHINSLVSAEILLSMNRGTRHSKGDPARTVETGLDLWLREESASQRSDITTSSSSSGAGPYTQDALKAAMNRAEQAIMPVLGEERFFRGRHLFWTDAGFVGLAPATAQPGDSICIIAGARVPFVLRETFGGAFEMIGECLVWGLMHGEAMEAVPEGKVETVVLV